MLDLDAIKIILKNQNISEVANDIGMSRQQLWAILNSEDSNPRLSTMKKLNDYIRRKHGKNRKKKSKKSRT